MCLPVIHDVESGNLLIRVTHVSQNSGLLPQKVTPRVVTQGGFLVFFTASYLPRQAGTTSDTSRPHISLPPSSSRDFLSETSHVCLCIE